MKRGYAARTTDPRFAPAASDPTTAAIQRFGIRLGPARALLNSELNPNPAAGRRAELLAPAGSAATDVQTTKTVAGQVAGVVVHRTNRSLRIKAIVSSWLLARSRLVFGRQSNDQRCADLCPEAGDSSGRPEDRAHCIVHVCRINDTWWFSGSAAMSRRQLELAAGHRPIRLHVRQHREEAVVGCCFDCRFTLG